MMVEAVGECCEDVEDRGPGRCELRLADEVVAMHSYIGEDSFDVVGDLDS